MHGLYVALWFIIIIIESVCESVIGRVCAGASHPQLACTAHSCHIVCVTSSSSSSCMFGLKFTDSKRLKGRYFIARLYTVLSNRTGFDLVGASVLMLTHAIQGPLA